MSEFPSAQLSTHILPPGSQDSKVYGYLYVEIGKLLWLKGSKTENSKVKVEFWGDRGQGQILRPVNASKELYNIPTAIQYEIRCPLVNFHKYLQDSSRLKFFVLDARNDKPLGNVIIALLLHLKHNLTRTDLTPLNEINDSFPIQKLVKPGTNEIVAEKIGELEIKVSAAFLPQVSQQQTEQNIPRGLLDSADNHLTSSFTQNEMRAAQEVATGSIPRDFYADEDPSIFYNRDTRIANSLLPTRDQNQYNPGSFRPQEIFRVSQNQGQTQYSQNPFNSSPPRQNTGIQGRFNTSSPQKDTYNSRTAQNLNDQQLDDQFEQVFMKTRNLHNQITVALNDGGAGQTFGDGFGVFRDQGAHDRTEHYKSAGPFTDFNFTRDPTNPLNQSIELERAKLEMDKVLFGENYGKEGETGPQHAPETRKGPLNFNEIDSLKITIDEFICENITLREKINERKIFVECSVPSSAGTPQNPVFDTYKFFAKNSEGMVWNFRNELTQAISQKEGEFKKLFNSNILFKIFMVNSDTSRGSSDVNFEIASGELSVEKIVLSPNYAGTFYIRLNSKAPLNQPQQPQKAEKEVKGKKGANTTTNIKGSQKLTKPAGTLVKSETLTEVGDLKVSCKFSGKREVEELKERAEQEKRSSFARGQEEEGTFVPLQTLLYIDRIPKITPRKDLQFPFRNLYLSYKIYGTNEKVQSEVRWKTNTPYFDHKLVFPVSREYLLKMYNVPFIVEVWDKSEGSRDEFVGLVKLNLEKVPSTLLDEETGEINSQYITANQYPMLVYDDSIPVPIVDLKTGQENGQIQLLLAVGTPGQLNKFESKIQQKRNQYAEVPERIRYVSSPTRTVYQEEREPEPIQEQKKASPQKGSPFKKYEANLEESERVIGVNAYESFVEVMERIRRHSDEATIKSHSIFMSQEKIVSGKDLTDFLLEPAYTIKGDYCRKVVKLLDIEKKGMIPREYFTRSYLSYLEYEQQVRSRFSEIAKDLKTLLNQQNLSVMAFEKVLNGHSEFGFIKKSVLKETFQKMNLNLGPQMMEYILGLLDYENNGLVFISHLTDYLKALEVYNSLNYLNLNSHFFIEKVANLVKDVVKANDISKEKLDTAFQGLNKEDNIIRIDNIMQILLRIGCEVTFWEALSLLESVKSKMNVINSEETRVFINGKIFYAWLYMSIGRDLKVNVDTEEEFLSTPKKEEIPVHSAKKENEDDHNNSIDDIAELLNSRPMKKSPRETSPPLMGSDLQQSQKKQSPSPKVSPKGPNRSLLESDNIVQEKPKSQKGSLSPRLPMVPRQKDKQKLHRGLLKHILKFTIVEMTQLNLDQKYERSQCAIRYVFPSTQDLIESNIIDIQEGQRDYQIDLVSKYTWTLPKNQNLVEHLKNPSDGVILQLVRKDDVVDEVLGYVILPFDDLSYLVDRAESEASSAKAKGVLHKTLLFLRSGNSRGNFSFQNDLVVAKLAVVLEYEKNHPPVAEVGSDESASEEEEANLAQFGKSGARSRSREVKEVLYEKETSLLRLIPKKGYFIFKIDAISELRRGLEYISEKNKEVKDLFGRKYNDGPKLAVYFDIFWEDSTLQNVVAPFEVDLPGRQIDLDEVIVDKTVSKYAEMSSNLIDYIQHKTAKVEVRLYLGKEEDQDEEERSQAQRRNSNYVVVCGCKIPLLSLFTSERVQGEFPLTNSMEYYCGLISLQISFNKENKIGLGARAGYMKNKEKALYVVALSFNEMLSIVENEERGRAASDKESGDTIFYLEFEVEEEVKRSSFYSLNKWKERIPLEDCFFNFTVDAHSEFFRKPLEIRLFEKRRPRYQDKILGFASLDFFGVIKNHLMDNKTFIQSFYCPLSDIEKAKVLKTRLGVKTAIVKVRNQAESKKLSKYMNVILGGDLSQASQKFRTQNAKFTETLSRTKLKDTFKQQTKLTYGELDDLSGLIAEEGDLISWEIFTKEVKPELHLDIPVDPELWKTLLADFVFYDSYGEGFVSIESVRSLLSHYSDELHGMDEEVQNRYKAVIDIKGLQTGYPKRAKNMFDYVIFMNKLELLDRREQYRKIHDNTRKVDAFLSSKVRSRSQSPYKAPTHHHQQSSGTLKLQIELQYGKNFQQLNNGKPPSSLVRCELGSRNFSASLSSQRVLAETPVVSRSSDPDFNIMKELTIDNFEDVSDKGDYGFVVKVFHRAFNANHSEELHKLNLVGEGFLSFGSVIKEDGKVYYNDFLEIQPVTSAFGLTQTARAMIKIKLAGNILSQGIENRDRRGEFKEAKESAFRSYRPYEDIYKSEENDEIPEFDDEVVKNFQKTLAEVNQGTKDILGSAEKVRRHFAEEDNEIQAKEDYDIEERLQSHSKAIRDIANITANLDSIIAPHSFGDRDQAREHRFADSSPEKDGKHEVEEVNRQETGTFAGGVTKTNPFARNLDENESPYKEKVGLISPDIKAEMPEELQSSSNEPFHHHEAHEEERKEIKEKQVDEPRRGNVVDKENSSENAVSRPSEETEKKIPSSGTSGSVSKPPLDDNSSTSKIKRLEQKFPKSMRNSGELARIARIMGNTGAQGKKTFYNSDSD